MITFSFQLNSYEVLPLSDLLVKPSSQVSFLLPSQCAPSFLSRRFPPLVDFHRMLLRGTHALALSAINSQLYQRSPYEYALGETRTHEIDLSIVGARTTYQATGDTGIHAKNVLSAQVLKVSIFGGEYENGPPVLKKDAWSMVKYPRRPRKRVFPPAPPRMT